jgi:hypothetical protein
MFNRYLFSATLRVLLVPANTSTPPLESRRRPTTLTSLLSLNQSFTIQENIHPSENMLAKRTGKIKTGASPSVNMVV